MIINAWFFSRDLLNMHSFMLCVNSCYVCKLVNSWLCFCCILADRTECSMTGYWHDNVVCPSVCLWRCALWLNDTSYIRWTSEYRNCPARNTIYLQLSTQLPLLPTYRRVDGWTDASIYVILSLSHPLQASSHGCTSTFPSPATYPYGLFFTCVSEEKRCGIQWLKLTHNHWSGLVAILVVFLKPMQPEMERGLRVMCRCSRPRCKNVEIKIKKNR